MAEDTRKSVDSGRKKEAGPFLATVVSHLDKSYMGTLEVQIYRQVGNNKESETELQQARYLSPFYGVTNVDFVSDDEDNYNNTQKSYGMWMIPPDVGSTVMVIYVETWGYFWIGCVFDEKMNFMMPGYASTYYNVDETKATDKERVPVAEYNRIIGASTLDATIITKPATPFETVLDDQGLLEDDIRGITTSSARRETPSMVFGISTPGPLDKQPGAKLGNTGKKEHKVKNTPVSRLGGSSFVMDDGDDKFLRKTSASEGPPDYAALEHGDDKPDDTKLLHNELVRLRTRTGHQILLHNTEDLIYIGNARGTAWIELTSDGKIDIYAEDSVSLHTKQDLNFYADRDINFEAGRNFNTKVAGEMHTHVIGDQILIVDANQKIHIKAAVDITYDTTYTHHVKEDVNILFDANYLHHVKSDVDWVFDSNWKHKVTGQVDWNFQQGLNWDVGGGSGGGATVNSNIFGSEIVKRTGNVDYTVIGNRTLTTTGNLDINTGGTNNLTAAGATNIKSGGNHIETAAQIHMNGPTAATAAVAAAPGGADSASEASEAELPKELKTHSVPDEEGSEFTQSIMRRIPTHEPWPHHENLDPMKFKPDQTDRDIDDRNEGNSSSIADAPEYWKKYSTSVDTFVRVQLADQEPEE